MTVKELISKLNSLNPDAKVLVDIMQENKSYGIFQLDPHMVDATYSGATIRIWLPSGSFITQKKKR